MFIFKLFIFMWSVLLCCATCEENSTAPSTKSLIHKYETDATSSRTLQQDDRIQMQAWSDEYQVRRLDVCVRYRLQMLKHQEHNFKSDGNVKWVDCLYAHRKDIRRSSSLYHEEERECLRATTSKDAGQREEVEQWEKQITKWRKGYRYLINLCHDENPGNQHMAELCLVQYMQSDKYDELIQRLLLLKQGSMTDLQAYYDASLVDLEECLKTTLSKYLDRVRAVMSVLNKCYSIIT